MNRSLLDTDILSETIKGFNPTVDRHATTYVRAFGALTISVVTLMEIVRGYHRRNDTARLNRFLAGLAHYEVLDLDPVAAELAGRIYSDLERTGRTIGWADTVIAAIAIRHGRELVTGNTAHYQRVAQAGYPLAVSNWRA